MPSPIQENNVSRNLTTRLFNRFFIVNNKILSRNSSYTIFNYDTSYPYFVPGHHSITTNPK